MRVDWLQPSKAIAVFLAESALPCEPGKYAFHVKHLDCLPKVFCDAAANRTHPSLLYIGKADVSLFERVWHQECQHRRPGTFFRSVGAMLGYRSPRGGKNYEFASDDKKAVIDWIASNLTVAWTKEPVSGSHRASERKLIQTFAPLLNIQHSPQKLAELVRLRTACRLGSA